MIRDGRLRVFAAVLVAAVLLGGVVQLMPERSRHVAIDVSAVATDTKQGAEAAYDVEVHERFQQAAAMLHTRQYVYALDALERVLDLSPNLPEAHVNAGFALLGVERPARAARFFERAIDLRPGQVNAYYGLAVALEELGDIDGALGAMRVFIHLSDSGTRHVARARAAVWEWSQQRKLDTTTASVQAPDQSDDVRQGGG